MIWWDDAMKQDFGDLNTHPLYTMFNANDWLWRMSGGFKSDSITEYYNTMKGHNLDFSMTSHYTITKWNNNSYHYNYAQYFKYPNMILLQYGNGINFVDDNGKLTASAGLIFNINDVMTDYGKIIGQKFPEYKVFFTSEKEVKKWVKSMSKSFENDIFNKKLLSNYGKLKNYFDSNFVYTLNAIKIMRFYIGKVTLYILAYLFINNQGKITHFFEISENEMLNKLKELEKVDSLVNKREV